MSILEGIVTWAVIIGTIAIAGYVLLWIIGPEKPDGPPPPKRD
jgi:phage shock protein PspC (stress-responsive transcriptional regulator)